MRKTITGILAGMILTGAILMGPLSLNSAAGMSGESDSYDPVSEVPEISPLIIRDTLEQAGENIEDEDTRRYYDLLTAEYNLTEGSYVSIGEDPDNVVLLPDIDNIARKALTLPLVEAGANIHDEEISRYYYELLRDSGWINEQQD
jgi:hypothetical protein